LSSEEPNLICTPEGTPYNPSDSNQAVSALVQVQRTLARIQRGWNVLAIFG
jgi:hypothetical protein